MNVVWPWIETIQSRHVQKQYSPPWKSNSQKYTFYHVFIDGMLWRLLIHRAAVNSERLIGTSRTQETQTRAHDSLLLAVYFHHNPVRKIRLWLAQGHAESLMAKQGFLRSQFNVETTTPVVLFGIITLREAFELRSPCMWKRQSLATQSANSF